MQIEYSDTDLVTILRVSGRIDTKNSSELEAGINSKLDSGKTNILLDFSDVSYISSSGLRVLLSAFKKIKLINGKMKLAGLKPFVLSVFKISGFTEIFEIYEDEKSAQLSFNE